MRTSRPDRGGGRAGMKPPSESSAGTAAGGAGGLTHPATSGTGSGDSTTAPLQIQSKKQQPDGEGAEGGSSGSPERSGAPRGAHRSQHAAGPAPASPTSPLSSGDGEE